MDTKLKETYLDDVKADTDSEACASGVTVGAGLQRRMKNRHIAMIRCVSVNVGRPFRRLTRTSTCFVQYWRYVLKLHLLRACNTHEFTRLKVSLVLACSWGQQQACLRVGPLVYYWDT